MRRLVLVLMRLAAPGCGSDSDSASKQPTPEQGTTTPSATATEEPSAAPSEAPDVKAAEDAARSELPNIPLWKGTQFRGIATSDTAICVNRILKRSSAALLGGGRTSHVVVSWPDLSVGEPKEGPCAKAQQNADKAIVAARRFYLRMDDDAVALDDAVKAAQDGAADAISRLSRLRSRILNASTPTC